MNRQARRQSGGKRRDRRPAGRPTPVRVGRRRPPLMPIAIIVGAAAVIGVLVFVVMQASGGSTSAAAKQKQAAEDLISQDRPGLPGTFYPTQGNDHLNPGTVYPICSDTVTDKCYKSNPPTSGPHDPNPTTWGVHDTAVPKEQLVHNMEHSGVIIWYNTDNKDTIAQLTQLVKDAAARGKKRVVMSPYPDMDKDTIALTAWTRLDSFSVSDFTPDRVNTFITKLEGYYNPEGTTEP